MSLSVNPNAIRQVGADYAQEPLKEEHAAETREESRFILMKANQHATLSKLGLEDHWHQDNELAAENCDSDCPCKGCAVDCIIDTCGYDAECPCPQKTT